MDRRAFLDTLAGGLLAAPLAAEAQTGKMPREYHYRVLANPSTNADSTHSGKDYGKVATLRGRTYSLNIDGRMRSSIAYPNFSPS